MKFTKCPAMTCAEIVDDAPCGKRATRFNRDSGVLFCDEHGGQNPLLPLETGRTPRTGPLVSYKPLPRSKRQL